MSKMKIFGALAGAMAAFVLASSAYATQPGNNGGGNGGCGVGQQTNGCGGSSGGAGGNGGTGGAGGNAAQGQLQGQLQGQAQGQAQQQAAIAAQGQAQSSRNNNRNTVNGTTTSSNINGASSSNSAYISTGSTTVSVEGAKGDVTNYAAQERAPVATAYAAPLTASNGTCMGSTSAGGQGAAFGVSFGTTCTDSSCDIRYDAEALRAAGLPLAAQARLCQKADIAKAMEAAGTPCPGTGAKRAEAILNGAPVVASANTAPQYSDPIIRARMGLPPLK